MPAVLLLLDFEFLIFMLSFLTKSASNKTVFSSIYYLKLKFKTSHDIYLSEK